MNLSQESAPWQFLYPLQTQNNHYFRAKFKAKNTIREINIGKQNNGKLKWLTNNLKIQVRKSLKSLRKEEKNKGMFMFYGLTLEEYLYNVTTKLNIQTYPNVSLNTF